MKILLFLENKMLPAVSSILYKSLRVKCSVLLGHICLLSLSTNQRPVFRSRDQLWPIRGPQSWSRFSCGPGRRRWWAPAERHQNPLRNWAADQKGEMLSNAWHWVVMFGLELWYTSIVPSMVKVWMNILQSLVDIYLFDRSRLKDKRESRPCYRKV